MEAAEELLKLVLQGEPLDVAVGRVWKLRMWGSEVWLVVDTKALLIPLLPMRLFLVPWPWRQLL